MLTEKKIFFTGLICIFVFCCFVQADVYDNAVPIKVSGGEDHTLVLFADETVWSCGANGGLVDYSDSGYQTYYYYGALGTGSDSTSLISKILVCVDGGDMGTPDLTDIIDIDSGWTHSLAIDEDNYVWAWGNNHFGQLGDNSTDSNSTPIKVRNQDDSGYLANIESVSAGRSGSHSLAVDSGGFVWGWGFNHYGQLGNGQNGTDEKELLPDPVLSGEQSSDPNLQYITAVSAGAYYSMALEERSGNGNGLVYTFGRNNYGQLGIDNTTSQDEPVKVLSGEQSGETNLEDIIAISAGWNHCMALDAYGYVFTWGRNGTGYEGTEGGRLGDGTKTDRKTPVVVLCGEQDTGDPNLKYITAISAGEAHSMALDANGFVYTWGDNTFGQLGNDTDDPCSLTPVRVVGEHGEGYLSNIVSISAGYWHCIAVDSDGTIWTWGKGASGRLGLNSTSDSNVPVRVPVVYNVTQDKYYFTIYNAIDNANNDDIIELSQGLFREKAIVQDVNITLRSTDIGNWDVVENTIIDGAENNEEYAAYFLNRRNCKIEGLTLHGNAEFNNSFVDINSCVIINCSSDTGIKCTNNSSISVINGKILNNGKQGIYCNSSTLEVQDCLIANNSSSSFDGGGICCSGSALDIKNTTIVNNSGKIGGGIYNYNSDVNICSCILGNNITSGTQIGSGIGGGIYNYNDTYPFNIDKCIFVGNEASRYGGGIYNEDINSLSKITNSIFVGNTAGYEAGGIENDVSSPLIYNCTIIKNYANSRGGGLQDYNDSNPMIKNCIFWNNKAVSDGNEIDNYNLDETPLSEPNFSYCDIKEGLNGVGCGGSDSIDGGGNIDDDPCFITVSSSTGTWTASASYDSDTFQSTLTDTSKSWAVGALAGKFIDPNTNQRRQFLIVSNDANTIKVWGDVSGIATSGDSYEIFDYHLSNESNCLDAGNPDTDSDDVGLVDLDGEVRFVDADGDSNSFVDMGAYEYYGAIAYWKLDDDATSTTVIDSGPNSIHGTAQDNTENLSTIGKIDGALMFDGSNDYIAINEDAGEIGISSGGSRSYSLWFKTSTACNTSGLISDLINESGNPRIPIYKGADILVNYGSPYVIQGHIGDGTSGLGSLKTIQYNTDYRDGNWHHVVLIYSSSESKAYLWYDGECVGNVSVTLSESHRDLEIGRTTVTGNKFIGDIDDVRIYDEALSGDYIEKLYDTRN